jgi:hypothetical protein
MRKVIHLTSAQVEEAARARRIGFLDAILSIARSEGDRLAIHTCDWHALTRQFTTGKPVKPNGRPCCEEP